MPKTTRKKAAGRRRKPAAALCACGIAVDAEEREHLVRACAFFRADRFRAAEPGRVRARDLEDAAATIDAVLEGGQRPLAIARSRRRQPKRGVQ
jgi:hypothetical protein